MLRFRCHKEVEAGKILVIEPVRMLQDNVDSPGVVKLTVAIDKGTEDVFVDYNFMDRHLPAIGGYVVKYFDGYVSYSPQAPFEAGYTKTSLMDECNSKMAQKVNEGLSAEVTRPSTRRR